MAFDIDEVLSRWKSEKMTIEEVLEELRKTDVGVLMGAIEKDESIKWYLIIILLLFGFPCSETNPTFPEET